jgi:NAD(P)-dependent dehydrogenase (short-subunit alcohol dehydrogenase family)
MQRFLAGHRALILGGSGGIGAAVSVAISQAGASVTVHGGHDQTRLAATVQRCREAGGEAESVLAEFRVAEQVLAVLNNAGPIDILVVSLGPYLDAPLEDTSLDQWRTLTELNLLLPAYAIAAVVPGMVERHYGRIILFGGPRSDRIGAFRRIAAYASTKAALASLTRSVATQYAASNIRCNMIAPGYVATEYVSQEELERLRQQRPTGQLVDSQQIAALCIHLLRSESDSINGAIIPVDYGE